MQITSRLTDGGAAHLLVAGEIDVSTAAELTAAGEQALAAPGCRGLVVEMGDVSFLDSTGLGALVGLRNASLAAEAGFELAAVSEPVRRILELTGMISVFAVPPAQG
jgi:anti-sigma B factor antagonist